MIKSANRKVVVWGIVSGLIAFLTSVRAVLRGENTKAADEHVEQLPLPDIQGNILAGFRNYHQAFLLVSFRDEEGAQQRAREWLDAQLAVGITSAEKVQDAEKEWRDAQLAAGIKSKIEVQDAEKARRREMPPDHPDLGLQTSFRNVSLTYSGLVVLDPETQEDLDRFDAFKAGPIGMRRDIVEVTGPGAERQLTTAEFVGDIDANDPSEWKFGKTPAAQQAIHALLTITAGSAEELERAVQAEKDDVKNTGSEVLHYYLGEAIRKDFGDGKNVTVEHFGFRDGISQPRVRGFVQARERLGTPKIAPGEFLLGWPRENGPCKGHIRHPEPEAPEWMRNGSFQVFRRLGQDVKAWREQVRTHAKIFGYEDEFAAKLIGRWQNGTPLALETDKARAEKVADEEQNDFHFQEDPLGDETPRFAHIRKVNPRDDRFFCTAHHRIIRRGITFGPRFDPDKEGPAGQDDKDKRGLLFVAFMSSFRNQFEFLQQNWADDPAFPAYVFDPTSDPHNGDGCDAVIGAVYSGSRCAFRHEGQRTWLDFHRHVYNTGAVYAFAPSIPTLESWRTGIE